MKSICLVIPILLILSCSRPAPAQEDYLGVYEVIKVEEGGQSENTIGMNHIELTDKDYIFRSDRNGDNRFAPGEVGYETYEFDLDEEGVPYIVITGDGVKISLKKDNYYDLIFERTDQQKRTYYTKNIRYTGRYRGKYIKSPESGNFFGEYSIVKFRENGTIININYDARIEITEDMYFTVLDLNRNGLADEEEMTAAVYSLHGVEAGKPYMKMAGSESKVYLMSEATFDLLLVNIDPLGNETVMYLKKM